MKYCFKRPEHIVPKQMTSIVICKAVEPLCLSSGKNQTSNQYEWSG